MAGPCLDPQRAARVHEVYAETGNISETSRITGVAWATVKKYLSQMSKNCDTSAKPVVVSDTTPTRWEAAILKPGEQCWRDATSTRQCRRR